MTDGAPCLAGVCAIAWVCLCVAVVAIHGALTYTSRADRVTPLANTKPAPPPKLLLISLDGFRYDLVTQLGTPNIWKFAKNGVHFTKGVQSQYFTVTADNHASIATGLFTESHGIVGNMFYDRKLDQYYDLFNFSGNSTDAKHSLSADWCAGNPIWILNEQNGQGRKSACWDWPAGDANYSQVPDRPAYYRGWTSIGNVTVWNSDVDKALTQLADPDGFNFVAFYVAQPDEVLHQYGFGSKELAGNLTELDQFIAHLVDQLDALKLTNEVNIVLTADHGHDQIRSLSTIICVGEYVDLTKVKNRDLMFYCDSEEQIEEVYQNLTRAVNEEKLGMKVFKKTDFPAQFHYKEARDGRVGDVIVEQEEGWVCVMANCTKASIAEQWKGKNYSSSTHGQDPNIWQMHAMLIMSGPDIKSGLALSNVPQNVDSYPLMCHLLQIANCSGNNGTLSNVANALRTTATHSPRNVVGGGGDDQSGASSGLGHFEEPELPDGSIGAFSQGYATLVGVGIIGGLAVLLIFGLILRRTAHPAGMASNDGYRPLPVTMNELKSKSANNKQTKSGVSKKDRKGGNRSRTGDKNDLFSLDSSSSDGSNFEF